MRIYLTSPAYANGGRYLEVGAVVGVGTEKHEITAERADDLVVADRATEVDDEPVAEGEGA